MLGQGTLGVDSYQVSSVFLVLEPSKVTFLI